MHLYLTFSSFKSVGRPTQVWWYHMSQKSQHNIKEPVSAFPGCLQMQNRSYSLLIYSYLLRFWKLITMPLKFSIGLIFKMVLANIFQMVAISLRESRREMSCGFWPSVMSCVSLMCFLSWSRVTDLELLKICAFIWFHSINSFWWVWRSRYSFS